MNRLGGTHGSVTCNVWPGLQNLVTSLAPGYLLTRTFCKITKDNQFVIVASTAFIRCQHESLCTTAMRKTIGGNIMQWNKNFTSRHFWSLWDFWRNCNLRADVMFSQTSQPYSGGRQLNGRPIAWSPHSWEVGSDSNIHNLVYYQISSQAAENCFTSEIYHQMRSFNVVAASFCEIVFPLVLKV